MSNLTTEQIEDLGRFSVDFEKYLNDNSVVKEDKKYRHVTKEIFGEIFKAVTRLSGLKRVMNSTTFYEENGRTKMTQQKRYGGSHPQAGELMFKPDGKGGWKPAFEDKRAVLYKAEAYRDMRTEKTGLSTPETVYYVKWAEVPEFFRKEIAEKFPWPVEDKAQFVPTNVCLVFRKGNKPARGDKRHQWTPPEFVVSGKFGEDSAVLTKAIVWERGRLGALAEATGIDPVDLTDSETQTAEPIDESLKVAANTASLLQAGAILLEKDSLF